MTMTVPLAGGLNQAASPIAMGAGELIQCANFLCDRAGGYTRVAGYDRFDGQTAPWLASDKATQDSRRAVIQAVPGVGAVLGVAVFNGCVVAVRNAVGGASAAMYRSSSTGWTLIKSGLPAGGRYRFAVGNVQGFSGQQRLFGVSGTRKGFAVNADWSWVDITTGMATDAPIHIAIHKNHLFFAFAGGSVQHSALANPFGWTVASGATEIAMPDEITGLDSHRGVLIIRTKSSIHQLSGSSVSDWSLAQLAAVGSLPDLAVPFGDDLLHVTRSGAQALQATAAYGDFLSASLSERIPVLAQSLQSALCVLPCPITGSVRWFCSGTALSLTVGQGWTQVNYPMDVQCCWMDRQLGKFIGAADGCVYQLDVGYTFAGADIDSFLRIAPFTAGDVGRRKRFRRVVLEVSSPAPVTIGYTPEFDYAAISAPAGAFNPTPPLGARFGSAVFDASAFDSASESARLPAWLSGTGFALGLTVGHVGATPSFRINAITYEVSPRGRA